MVQCWGGDSAMNLFCFCRRVEELCARMPKSKELVSSSSSASGSDSEVDKKAKRKKQVAPEKPVKKQKTGESSKGAASSKQSSNRDENMFQVSYSQILLSSNHICKISLFHLPQHKGVVFDPAPQTRPDVALSSF
ncbi:uncharacterized protein LOC134564875 isoform X2 [Prinia subflava]|uniref:uncharacterized protein LOC134564875 isoform X2 n=1 Tax=Prinia subflava TaxID=208062 RepID=UPI002FE380C6